MNTATTAVALHDEFRAQMQKRRNEFAELLPSHIEPTRFERVAITAIQRNPELLECDRRSLFNELKRCAHDGLEPDGKQAVVYVRRHRELGKVACYEQMVQGIRRLVQQSGEITRFDQAVVRENDFWGYQLGDRPFIHHKPTLTDRGAPIAVYSIAQFRDGTLSREVMSFSEVEKRRAVSRAKDGAAWTQWWDEMAMKTVAKHHAKVLPMATDTANALAADDAATTELPLAELSVVPALPQTNRPRNLAAKLDALGTADDEPKRPRRGRHHKDDEPTDQEIEQSQARIAEVLEEEPDDTSPLTGDEPELQTEVPDDGWPGPSGAVRHDYEQGKRDAIAGRSDCLNRDIRDIATRFAEWKKGFDSVKRK